MLSSWKRIATSLMLAGTLSLPLAQTAQAQDGYVRDNRGRVVTDQYGNPLHDQGNGKSIGIIGGSTAGGAVLGGLIGGTKGAVLGGLAGAGAGVVIDKHRRDQRDEEIRQDAYNNGAYGNGGYYGNNSGYYGDNRYGNNNGYSGDNRDGYYRQNSGYDNGGWHHGDHRDHDRR
jgi:hypothetical protein